MQSSADAVSDDRPHTRRQIQFAWALHALTASGVIVGFIGLNAVIEGHARAAILLLVAAMVLDGIDGPIARRIRVSERLPNIDGNALDLIVDYFTCTIVPVAFLDKFGKLPHNTVGATGLVILFTGALWMARSDMETDDNWFRGFPAEWNVIIPTLYLLHLNAWVNLGICALLCAMSITYTFEFPHTVRVRERRVVSITMMVLWLGSMTALAVQQDRPTEWLRWMLALTPLWTAWQVAERFARKRLASKAAASAPR